MWHPPRLIRLWPTFIAVIRNSISAAWQLLLNLPIHPNPHTRLDPNKIAWPNKATNTIQSSDSTVYGPVDQSRRIVTTRTWPQEFGWSRTTPLICCLNFAVSQRKETRKTEFKTTSALKLNPSINSTETGELQLILIITRIKGLNGINKWLILSLILFNPKSLTCWSDTGW